MILRVFGYNLAMSLVHKIKKKISSRNFNVGIIGLGYVGLPLLLRFAEQGFHVTGIDLDERKVKFLKGKKSYINHISNEDLKQKLVKGNFTITSNFEAAKKCDALIICVPTPLNDYREPDLSYVVSTIDSLIPYIKKGQIISLESTTYPGTTEEEIVRKLEDNRFSVGEDIFVLYSPEREDPGNLFFSTHNIPKLCGGYTKKCLDLGLSMYSEIIEKVISVNSLKTAEMAKLLENIHRSVNIGLVNEMKIVADKMGIDIYDVVEAASTKPFGFTPYYPGPGLGGHCIPIDPYYLTWKAKEYGINTRFIELSGEVNRYMPEYVIEKLAKGLNDQKKSIKGSSVLVLGIAYKKNIDDMRESPSVKIIEMLKNLHANVDYSDPHVPIFPKMRKYNFNLKSKKISAVSLNKYDAVIIATDHDSFDFKLIKNNSNLIIDTRGRYRNLSKKIIRA